MDNEKKCNKYEACFIFQDEAGFNAHINECEECRKEHEKYLKVSNLIKEAASDYLKKAESEKRNNIKKLACCFIAFIGLVSFYSFKSYENNIYQADFSDDSYISSMGLPIDDYGFLEL